MRSAGFFRLFTESKHKIIEKPAPRFKPIEELSAPDTERCFRGLLHVAQHCAVAMVEDETAVARSWGRWLSAARSWDQVRTRRLSASPMNSSCVIRVEDAPQRVVEHATIMNLGSDGKMKIIQEGSNGRTCMDPDGA